MLMPKRSREPTGIGCWAGNVRDPPLSITTDFSTVEQVLSAGLFDLDIGSFPKARDAWLLSCLDIINDITGCKLFPAEWLFEVGWYLTSII